MRRLLAMALVLACLITLAACSSSSPGYIIMLPEDSTGSQTATSTALPSSTSQTQSAPDTTPPVTTAAAATTVPPVTTLPLETTAPSVTDPPPTQATETQPPETEPVGMEYVLNTSSKKFHYPTCSSVKQMKDKNKAFFTGTREALLEKGYSPCGRCHP